MYILRTKTSDGRDWYYMRGSRWTRRRSEATLLLPEEADAIAHNLSPRFPSIAMEWADIPHRLCGITNTLRALARRALRLERAQ